VWRSSIARDSEGFGEVLGLEEVAGLADRSRKVASAQDQGAGGRSIEGDSALGKAAGKHGWSRSIGDSRRPELPQDGAAVGVASRFGSLSPSRGEGPADERGGEKRSARRRGEGTVEREAG
jgi:hypothetical protein